MINNPDPQISPKWSTSFKLVAALIFITIISGLLIKFQFLISPLIIAFILAYLLLPVAKKIQAWLKLQWKASVNILYLIFILILLGLLIWGGIAILDQLQKLIDLLQTISKTFPASVEQFLSQPISIGRWVINLSKIDLLPLAQQILGTLQPALSKTAQLIGQLAKSAVTAIGWLLFAVLISYFILHETNGIKSRLINFQIPRYSEDIKRIGQELSHIWNAFLRRQILILVLTIGIYTLLLGVLGVKYFFGLALMAGLARFIPYIGPLITWITYGFVSYFQGTTLFNMNPLTYAITVAVVAYVVDNIFDLFVTPRLMADALKLHPAAVMIAALVGLELFGVIGLILAAPILATIKLFFDFSRYKMLDEDPWLSIQTVHREQPPNKILVILKKFLIHKKTNSSIRKRTFLKTNEKTVEKSQGDKNG
jgi:predicted PurR-regulated permease PerM